MSIQDLAAEDLGVGPDTKNSADLDDLADVSASCIEVQAGAMTTEGQPSDGWTWEKGTRLFQTDPDPAKARQGDFSPSVVKTERGYRLYFARRRDAGFSIWTSKSDDGISWESPVAVEGLTGQNVLSALYKDGETRLWFGSGSFDTAKSVDGVNFDNQISRIIKTPDVGALGSLSILDPKVYADDAGFKMWFTGFDGVALRIGTAESADGVIWTNDGQVVLEGTAGTNFDSKSVGSALVRKYGDKWYMWYSGYDVSKTDPGPWRIGLATSADAKNWTREGVTMPLSETGDDMWSTRDASVFENEEGGLSMVYVGMSDDSHYRLLSAVSSTCR